VGLSEATVGEAWAQTGAASGPPAIYNVGFLLVMVAIFYFILLRPEQKRRRTHETLLANLKRNDQVVMNSGMHGRVIALADTTITLEIAPKVNVQFDRSAVQTVVGLPAKDAKDSKEREKA
jgi:preprotein translocase subunit YajC